jgi:hypothetical protein
MVFVSPTAELVTLHTNLLLTATQDHIDQINAGRPTFQLPNEDPDIFRIFRLWLYDRQLYTIAVDDKETHRAGQPASHKDAE